MKYLILLLFAFSLGIHAQQQVDSTARMPKHPRLLLQRGQEKNLMRDIKRDTIWTQIHQSVINVADAYVAKDQLTKRQLEGKRLLGVSREVLKRTFFLCYAYRTTGKSEYLQRARAEILNVSAFQDWNPSHFLDVAEMTLAVSLGYDWLYDQLTPSERATLEQAILQKGLIPSLDKKVNWFVDTDNNWNQVCHAGMVYGALAVWERNRTLASQMVNRAIENLPIAMAGYAPHGAYPEGTGYWDYGTAFNVLLLDAISQVFGTDFGLTQAEGFMQTGQYITHTSSPSLFSFCYSDNGSHSGALPVAFWFYRQTKDASILYNQMRILHRRNPESITSNRLAPAALIWGHQSPMSKPQVPTALAWTGDGVNPIFVTRSGWGYDDAFMGMKCGKAASNHAHMDEGSFIYESHGVRWAVDLGTESYNNLEQAGIGIWNARQNSDRWTVYRYNNFAHNTLTFDGQLQVANAKAEFNDRKVDFPGYAQSDLSSVYKGQVKSVTRRCSLRGVDDLVVEDCITTLDHATRLTWTLMTEAAATVIDNSTLQLKQKGHTLFVRISGSPEGRWAIEPATPLRSCENQNKGVTRIQFNTILPSSKTTNLAAAFTAQ